MTSRKNTVESGPRARTERILVEEVGDETVIYDLDTSVAHALKPLAAAVFAVADGTRDSAEIAELCQARLSSVVTESDVYEALTQLEALDLVQVPELAGVSRRDALKVFAAAGAGAVLVSSVAAPAALAGTTLPAACSTGVNTQPNANPWNKGYCTTANYNSWDCGFSQTSWGPQPSSGSNNPKACITTSDDYKCWLPSQGCLSNNVPNKGGWDSSPNCWQSNGCPDTTTIPCNDTTTCCTYSDTKGNCYTDGQWQCVPVNCGGTHESASHCQVVCAPQGRGCTDWGPGCKSGYSVQDCYTSASSGFTSTGCWGVYRQV